MSRFYDENFGWYNMESDEDVEFYKTVQKDSVEKQCEKCNRTVRILPEYGICNTCADKIERGYDL